MKRGSKFQPYLLQHENTISNEKDANAPFNDPPKGTTQWVNEFPGILPIYTFCPCSLKCRQRRVHHTKPKGALEVLSLTLNKLPTSAYRHKAKAS